MTVNKFIGICKPIAPPNTFTKNKNNMPIPSFIVVWPIKRIGLTGAPTINNKIINATMIVITTVELTIHQPFPCPLYSTYARFIGKRTEKDTAAAKRFSSHYENKPIALLALMINNYIYL